MAATSEPSNSVELAETLAPSIDIPDWPAPDETIPITGLPAAVNVNALAVTTAERTTVNLRGIFEFGKILCGIFSLLPLGLT